MTHSNLTSFCMLSPNGYFPRSDSIRKVTIHHMAGVMTAEQCGYVFSTTARQASSNYGIGNDGEIACYVEEENAAWTSSSYWNDNQAITMEVSNSYAGDPWPISDAAWKSMIALCVDICTRYGIEPSYTGDTSGTFTEHRMFAPTGCPGDYIHARMAQIVREVKAAMGNQGGKWIQDKRGWWYRRDDGSYPANEWEKINGKWYCFDADGYMRTGWILWDGWWYYCKPQSKAGETDYGQMLTGWQTIKWNGKACRFYFAKDSGAMFPGGFAKIDGSWYAFEDTGVLVTDDAKVTVDKSGAVKIA